MIEPYSEEEKEFIRYLVKKYLPGITNQSSSNCTSVMFDMDEEKKSSKNRVS